MILPLWHDVSRQDVLAYSPKLAETKAIATSGQTIELIVDAILDVIRAGTHSSWLLGRMRNALMNLDSTTFHGYGYDYWPHGGLRSLYDHLLTFISFSQLVRVFRGPVFLSGPHRNTEMDLNNQFEFGHYNPAFIEWLGANMRFLLRQSRFVEATAPHFERYVANLATLMYETYQVLAANQGVKMRLRDDYESAIRSGRLRPQYYWMVSWAPGDPRFPEDVRALMKRLTARYDTNVVSSALYFWLRREIDGTDRAIFSLLVDVLKAFSPASYTNINTFSNWCLQS